jgi:xylulokinase
MPPSSPAKDAILTFDLGTTRLKVALFTLAGRLVGQRTARHREHHEGGRSWQDADEWWADAVRLSRELLAAKPRRITAIAASGRAGAAVFIDRDGIVIGQPWSDRRHQRELDALLAWRKRGAHLSNYAAALLAKKQWFVANEPARARQLRHVLYAKDLLIYRLTGVATTDPSSGPDAPDWDPTALAHCSAANLVPRVAPPWAIAGPLNGAAAQALTLTAGIPVVVGGHDGICANVGAGAGYPAAYAITLGTHAVVRAITHDMPAGAFRFYDLPPNRHVIGGNAVLAGRAADWFADLVHGANDRARPRHFKALDNAAAQVPAGARGLRFLPFLAGQVAPQSRPGATAVFTGLRLSHDRAALYRAVLEGGAFAIRAIFEQIESWCGAPAVVRLTGSGATSPVWCQILADVVGQPLEATDAAVEGRGAAIFAMVALGHFADYDAAAQSLVKVSRRYVPDAASAAIYTGLYEDWCRVADATRPLDASQHTHTGAGTAADGSATTRSEPSA